MNPSEPESASKAAAGAPVEPLQVHPAPSMWWMLVPVAVLAVLALLSR